MRMMMIAVGLLASCTAAEPTDDYPFPDGDSPLGKADSITNLPVAMNAPIAGSFDQQIDHPRQGASTLGTFQQRYWYSTQFAKSEDAPVLFYFCGEAPCDPWKRASP